MNILAINCGSSSVKFKLFEANQADLHLLRQGEEEVNGNHEEALRRIFSGLEPKLDVVAHRVVHGGERFLQSLLIDDSVLQEIEALSKLAPLHNPPALKGIRVTSHLNVPMVAVFDTSFYASLPMESRTYALPLELSKTLGIRRFGFHGISHQYVMHRFIQMSSSKAPTIITLHLGNGCSATAIREGKAVDTSMGFTPTEGLIMGTRTGDLDPAISLFLMNEGWTVSRIEHLLNRESGLKGLAGTNDMREILRRTDDDASLASDMFCYRVRKYIGAYAAALGGAEAIVFTGRIGERSAEIRRRICRGLTFLGLDLDETRETVTEGCISTENSRMQAYVIPTDEEKFMAEEAVRVLAMGRES